MRPRRADFAAAARRWSTWREVLLAAVLGAGLGVCLALVLGEALTRELPLSLVLAVWAFADSARQVRRERTLLTQQWRLPGGKN